MDDTPALRRRTVEALWNHFQAREWPAARALLVDAAVLTWHASGERLLDADAIVRVNAIYPEGWQLAIVEVNPLHDGRVHSIVEVWHGSQCFLANTLFRFDGPLIDRIDEYWATFEPPPDWRTAATLGAYERFSTRPTP